MASGKNVWNSRAEAKPLRAADKFFVQSAQHLPCLGGFLRRGSQFEPNAPLAASYSLHAIRCINKVATVPWILGAMGYADPSRDSTKSLSSQAFA